ncbi:MAG: hypothetical protein ACE5HU_06715 [Acidobacteriota bacterium]
MWGIVDELPSPGSKTITFMIYFRGDPGWHEGKWSFDAGMDKDPGFIEFRSDSLVLRSEYHRKSRMLRIFGTQVDTEKANVVVVNNVNHLDEERVERLGHFDLKVPEDASPATYLVRHYAAIREALFPVAK